MAKHPLADRARAKLEEQGIVLNANGGTSFAKAEHPEKVTPPPEDQPKQPDPSVKVDETPPASSTEDQSLLELQRAEIARLTAEVKRFSPQAEENKTQKSAREVELEQEIASLRSQMEEAKATSTADELKALLEQQGFDMESLDDDVAVELRDKLIKPVANKISALEAKLGSLQEKVREPTAAEKLEATKQKTYAKVVSEVPDFPTILNSKQFKERLQAKDTRFPTATYGEAMQIAYENGNHDFIIQEVKNFLSGGVAPDITKIADVGATNGVGSKAVEPPNGGSGFTFTPEEAVEMLRKVQRGQISRKEYSEYRAKLAAKAN